MLERLIRLSIRSHWLLLLVPLLAQYYIGATLLSRTPLIKLPNLLESLPWSADTLFEAHIVIGNLLVMAASFLTFEKMIVVLKPIIRAPIANGFISAHVQV